MSAAKIAASLRSTGWMGTLCTSPIEYSETRNRRATFWAPRSCPLTKTDCRFWSHGATCLGRGARMSQVGRHRRLDRSCEWPESAQSGRTRKSRWRSAHAPMRSFRRGTAVSSRPPFGHLLSAPKTASRDGLGASPKNRNAGLAWSARRSVPVRLVFDRSATVQDGHRVVMVFARR